MSQPNPSTKLTQALDHERKFIARVLNEENDSADAETLRCIQQRANTGRLTSPETKSDLLQIERECLERIIRKVIDNRFVMVADAPEIASDALLENLRRQIDETIAIRFRGMIPRIARATGSVWPEWRSNEEVDRSLEDEKLKLVAWARQELDYATSTSQISKKPMSQSINPALERTSSGKGEFLIGLAAGFLPAALGFIGITVNLELGIVLLLASFGFVGRAFWLWETASSWSVSIRWATLVVTFAVYCAILGPLILQQYHNQHPSPTLDKRLTFTASLLWTEQRKQLVSEQIRLFDGYLMRLALKPPEAIPMIRLAQDGNAVFAPGAESRFDNLVIGIQSFNEPSIRRMYADYVINQLIPRSKESLTGEAFFKRQWTIWILVDYFVASSLNRKPDRSPESLNGWVGALWDIRTELGADFTDRALAYGAASPEPQFEDFNEYFRNRLSGGVAFIHNDLSQIPQVNAILKRHGLQ